MSLTLTAIKSLPFILATGAEAKLNIPRVVEAVIIAGITMYGTQQVMAARLEGFEKAIDKIAATADEARKVQLEIVPMRNLQVKTLQENVEKLESRIAKLELKNERNR